MNLTKHEKHIGLFTIYVDYSWTYFKILITHRNAEKNELFLILFFSIGLRESVDRFKGRTVFFLFDVFKKVEALHAFGHGIIILLPVITVYDYGKVKIQ